VARYQFVCYGCAASAGADGVIHELEMPMKTAPSIGSQRKCVIKECKNKMTRIIPTGVNGIIKGTTSYNWKPGETMSMALPDGRTGKFSFVDHPHTDPKYQRNLADLARRQGIGTNVTGLKNARFDEKHGRLVVDVMSNVEDPLGALQRAKKDGNYEQTTTKINQPYKVRKGKKKK